MNLYTKILALLMLLACTVPAHAAVQGFDLSFCEVTAAEEDKKEKEGDDEPDCE